MIRKFLGKVKHLQVTIVFKFPIKILSLLFFNIQFLELQSFEDTLEAYKEELTENEITTDMEQLPSPYDEKCVKIKVLPILVNLLNKVKFCLLIKGLISIIYQTSISFNSLKF